MKSKITKKWWFWVVAVLIILSVVGKLLGLYDEPETATADPVPEVSSDETSPIEVDNSIAYEIVTSEDYGTGLKSHSFRMVINKNATDDQLKWVLSQLDNGSFEEITIWFYDDKTSIEKGDMYNVAMIERTVGNEIKLTRR